MRIDNIHKSAGEMACCDKKEGEKTGNGILLKRQEEKNRPCGQRNIPQKRSGCRCGNAERRYASRRAGSDKRNA